MDETLKKKLKSANRYLIAAAIVRCAQMLRRGGDVKTVAAQLDDLAVRVRPKKRSVRNGAK